LSHTRRQDRAAKVEISPMKEFHFIVAGNARLGFKDACTPVFEFVRSRLEAAGVGSLTPAAELGDAYHQASRLLRKISSGYVFVLELMNPLVDLELAREMAAAMDRTGHLAATCEGAIPGTQVEIGFSASHWKNGRKLDLSALKEKTVHVRWRTQAQHNNQLNLYKYKRLKMFLTLQQIVPDLAKQSVNQIISTLERDDVFARIVAFG
jgi:hypothetical protein